MVKLMNKINFKSNYKSIIFNYYLNEYGHYKRSSLYKRYSSQSNDLNKKEPLDNLNDLFKKFEKSVFRKDVLKSELYQKWETHLDLSRIQSTHELLENQRNNNDKYKRTTEYLLNKYRELDNKELSYVFKIYKNISKPIHSRDESTNKLLNLLDDEVIQRASTFDLSHHYDIYLGLGSDKSNTKLLLILEKQLEKSIKFTSTSTQQDGIVDQHFEYLEDKVIALDSKHNIWKIIQLLRFYDGIKSETKRESMYEMIKIFKSDQDKMDPFYLINCMGLVSSNVNSLLSILTDKYRIGLDIGDLVIKNKHHLEGQVDDLITSRFLYHLMNELVQTDLNEFKRLFEVLFKNMRTKLLNDANGPFEFFKYFGTLFEIIRCESNIYEDQISGDVMKPIRTQNKNRHQGSFNPLSTINSKLMPSTYASFIERYLDKELKDVIINKYDEMSEKCDLFSFKQLIGVYPTILQIHPNKEKATKIIYNRVLKACDEPFRFNPLKFVNLLIKNESKENEIKLCDKLMEYLPNRFDSMNSKEKDTLLSYLMRNEETLSKYYSFIIEKMKMLLKSKEDCMHLFTSLSSLNVHLPKLIEKDPTTIIELSKIMFDRSIEICVDANMVSLSKMDFIKYNNVLVTIQMILRFVKKHLSESNSPSLLSKIFQSSNMINYDNLVNLLSEENIEKGLDMYRHIINTDVLNELMVLSNRYSQKCLNDALYIIMFHLNHHLNKTIKENKKYSSTKDTRLLTFHLLGLFQHFDITNSKYFIENKIGFEHLMFNFYSSIILKDTYETRRVKNMFKYVSYLINLNLKDMVAFKHFITNLLSIVEMNKYEDFYINRIKQTLSIRYPKLNYEYNPLKTYFVHFDESILNELKDNFEIILKNKGNIKKLVKYPFGLSTQFELRINDRSLFNNQNDANESTIRIPVYLIDEKICHCDSYKPKRWFSLEIENLKALGHPVLELPIEEYKSKKDKIKYLSDKIEICLKF